LTCAEIFPGIGAYTLSEVLHRLWIHWEISPFEKCGKLSLAEDNILVILISICRVFILDVQSCFGEKLDLSSHNIPLLRSFYIRFLLAYRKPQAIFWKFQAIGKSKAYPFYTFCQESPTENLCRLEKWKSYKNSNPIRGITELGVGPLWWHSVGNFSQVKGYIYITL
jgi:hypothetical protein